MSLKGRRFLTQDEPEGWCTCLGLIISMQDGEKLSLEQIRAFLEASEEVAFEGKRRAEVYDWITRLLRRQDYPSSPWQKSVVSGGEAGLRHWNSVEIMGAITVG